MNTKRSYSVMQQQKGGAGRPGAKPRDAAGASSSRHSIAGDQPLLLADTAEAFINTVPLIRQADNARLLPRYSAILNRTPDDGVFMDDLDQLQMDLEKLISACAIRNRVLRAETESIDRTEEKRGNERKGKSFDKGSLKRKRPEDARTNRKDPNPNKTGGGKPLKRQHYPLPLNSGGAGLIGDATGAAQGQLRPEVPRIVLPKNDTSDKFWSSVEPYCAAITQSQASFLDKLMEECSQSVDVKIPELGDYYANEWNDSALELMEDQHKQNQQQESGKSGNAGMMDLKKNGLGAMVDTFSNPKTQRLLAVLIEERVMTSFPAGTGKLKPSDLNILKSAGNPRSAICMDRRLKKDLVEQGILSVEDLPKSAAEDEILQEIKKCQHELAAVNEYNVAELRRLKAIVARDLRRQQIKAELDRVDGQVLELYNKVLLAVMTTAPTTTTVNKESGNTASSGGGGSLNKGASTTKKCLKEFEVQTDALLKRQFQLQKELAELRPMGEEDVNDRGNGNHGDDGVVDDDRGNMEARDHDDAMVTNDNDVEAIIGDGCVVVG